MASDFIYGKPDHMSFLTFAGRRGVNNYPRGVWMLIAEQL